MTACSTISLIHQSSIKIISIYLVPDNIIHIILVLVCRVVCFTYTNEKTLSFVETCVQRTYLFLNTHSVQTNSKSKIFHSLADY